ncbi:phage holin family protein [Streptomyces sp. IBSBF 2806]|uniref:phage holin family protein n=1 Tax=Streptomyces sp. IBSBF 2806 TaxID=2903529 RepID=UPI002FDC65CF
MERIDHMEHLDRHLVDELAQVARETIREELREQTRKQRRTAMLYAASGALALYAGAAVAVALGLALGIGLPDWAAALITAVVLGVAAYLVRNAAKPGTARPGRAHGPLAGSAPSAGPAGAAGPQYPPVPPVPPVAPDAPLREQGGAPRAQEVDPGDPHPRG